MRRLLLVVLAALLLPAAAQAKEITGLAVCGPSECEDADVGGFGHAAPFGGDSTGPPRGPYYRLALNVDGQPSGWGLFYEPTSGLAAREDNPGTWVWSRLAPKLATAVKDAAKRVEPFPAPRVTGARVGAERVHGDASTYAALLRVDGPPVVPKTSEDAVPITLTANAPNPWTEVTLLWYPHDRVLFRSPGTYVRLADGISDDVDAARPLGSGGGTTVPWIPIAVALAGALALLLLGLRRATRPAPKPVAAP
ncbi:MAG TPA: hypothetical protein VGQ15_07325 [Gaiellaceae bacterium]|jgi:hypothetical protein|nr:hypothetical protein [Gaiellaceae bacterium]